MGLQLQSADHRASRKFKHDHLESPNLYRPYETQKSCCNIPLFPWGLAQTCVGEHERTASRLQVRRQVVLETATARTFKRSRKYFLLLTQWDRKLPLMTRIRAFLYHRQVRKDPVVSKALITVCIRDKAME